MTYVVHPINEAQDKAIRAVLEALQVPYEQEPDVEDGSYNQAFVTEIQQAQEDIKQGRGVQVDLKSFFEL